MSMEEHLRRISAWFDGFVASYRSANPEQQRNYDLKVEHTALVRSISERLAVSLGLSADQQALAAIIALCHDVGRFPQYHTYGTFNDVTSVNHAALSVETLTAAGVLAPLDEVSRRIITQAVALHNVFTLPDGLPQSAGLFTRLIRDADKLDIWRVLIDYCRAAPQERASAVVWELPDTGCCSRSALDEVIAGRMINRSLLATADDFKLLQISWAYDLNCAESFAILAERGYIETLAALLPLQEGTAEAVAAVRTYISTRGGHSPAGSAGLV